MAQFEWEVRGNFGQGWEMVTAAESVTEGRGLLKDYRDNDPEHAYKLVMVRIKKEKVEKYPKFGSGTGGGK